MNTMGADIEVVIPAYRPDYDMLLEYNDMLASVLDPDVIRVELDDPQSPDCPALINRAGVSVNVSESRRGKGAAITEGFDSLDTEIRLFLDADGATPPSSAKEIVEAVVTIRPISGAMSDYICTKGGSPGT